MNLEQRTASLLAVVDDYRRQHCDALLAPARAQAQAMVAAALREARRRVRTALAEERKRSAAALGAAAAQLATDTRLLAQRRAAGQLAQGWLALRQALQARWDDAGTRALWIDTHLARVRTVLAGAAAAPADAAVGDQAAPPFDAAGAAPATAPTDAASAASGMVAAAGAGHAHGADRAAAPARAAGSPRAAAPAGAAAGRLLPARDSGTTGSLGPLTTWQLHGPPQWPAVERSRVAALLRAQGAPAVHDAVDPALSAGFRVQAGHNVLDATLDGLLADRDAVQGRLLQLLERA